MQLKNDTSIPTLIENAVAESARLWTLRFLDEALGLNDGILLDLLRDTGHIYTREQVADLIGWLVSQKLVVSETFVSEGFGELITLELLERGQDIARGLRRHDGVAESFPIRRK